MGDDLITINDNFHVPCSIAPSVSVLLFFDIFGCVNRQKLLSKYCCWGHRTQRHYVFMPQLRDAKAEAMPTLRLSDYKGRLVFHGVVRKPNLVATNSGPLLREFLVLAEVSFE